VDSTLFHLRVIISSTNHASKTQSSYYDLKFGINSITILCFK
jgi:hypothetical protein